MVSLPGLGACWRDLFTGTPQPSRVSCCRGRVSGQEQESTFIEGLLSVRLLLIQGRGNLSALPSLLFLIFVCISQSDVATITIFNKYFLVLPWDLLRNNNFEKPLNSVISISPMIILLPEINISVFQCTRIKLISIMNPQLAWWNCYNKSNWYFLIYTACKL